MAEERNPFAVRVELHGRQADEELPAVALYRIGRDGRPAEKLAVAREGQIVLSEELLKKAEVIGVGPDAEEGALGADDVIRYRFAEVLPLWRETGIVLPRLKWYPWLKITVCLSGRVTKCFPFFPPSIPQPPLALGGAPIGPPVIFPQRCWPVCNGVVEIYERTCCCRRWVIFDPRLPDLLDKLRQIVKVKPKFPFPIPEPDPGPIVGPIPLPGPDPAPFLRRAELRQLKLAEATVASEMTAEVSERLVDDLSALEKLPAAEASQYVVDRPYLQHLLCTCSMHKVGEAVLNPDGSFTFCYKKPLMFHPIWMKCSTTYAYKVRQWQENQWVTVYDGVAKHEYFDADEEAILRAGFKARTCGEGGGQPVPHGKPFVMLEDIGSTRSYHLISPAQAALDGINSALPNNGGLVFPPPAGESADGRMHNCPWSQTLGLRLFVHPDMQALGATYYRISVVRADDNGNPMGGATPQPLTGELAWSKFVYVGGQVQVQGEALGPTSLVDGSGETQSGLYRIPYRDSSHLWLDGQFHGYWNTLAEANGRHLVSVEVFDAAGNRLRPAGATGAGLDRNFDLLRWADPVNTVAVPYAKLNHVFWTDKLPVYADIEDLRQNGVANTEECQFMVGSARSAFSAGFRAFHNNGPTGETFMYYYTMWYHRGLNGPNVTIETSGQNAPATKASGPAAVSTPQTFGAMLGAHTKCTFAVNLRVYAKHWNGGDRVHAYDREDQAAFALEIGA